MKLNLGAGDRIMADAVNHDRVKYRPEIAVAWDLNVLPWPWPDASFDFIVARSVFEHLQIDLVQVFDECWRLLQKGGQLFVKLPHWQSDVAYQDPTHRWHYSVHALDVFDPRTKRGRENGFYTKHKWDIVDGPTLNKAGSSFFVQLKVRK